MEAATGFATYYEIYNNGLMLLMVVDPHQIIDRMAMLPSPHPHPYPQPQHLHYAAAAQGNSSTSQSQASIQSQIVPSNSHGSQQLLPGVHPDPRLYPMFSPHPFPFLPSAFVPGPYPPLYHGGLNSSSVYSQIPQGVVYPPLPTSHPPNGCQVPPNQSQYTPQGASPPAPPRPWKADVYAPIYTPQLYMQINSLPAISVRSTPPPAINYPNYISSFAGTSFLRPLPPYPVLQAPTGKISELSPNNYSQNFIELLSRELLAQIQNLRRYDMYNVPLQVHDMQNFQYRLDVPGIREDCPLLFIGDMVHLRQLRTNGINSYPVFGFTGCQYEGYIYGMDRQGGYIILRIDELTIESGLFNVCFLVQPKDLGRHARAIIDCGNELTRDGVVAKPPPGLPQAPQNSGYLRKMLFPEKEDGVMQSTLTKAFFKHRWFDTELNFEQQKAVDAIIEQNYGTVPYLISGPPGTGKTKTIVEAALQLIFATCTKKHHILLCAPSNQAADTLAKRLVPHLSPRVLFRMNSPSRIFAEVPNELLTYCFVHNDSFGLPDWRKLMAYRVIVATCADCAMLVEARCTNRDLARWERVVNAGIKGEDLPWPADVDVGEYVLSDETFTGDSISLHWSALLIDEAAQSTESEALIALSVVAPPEEISTEKPMLVMAGDEKQLGPRTVGRESSLEISLLERLFSRPLYADHPLSRQAYSRLGGGSAPELLMKISQPLLPYIRPPFTNLFRNYRSHPAILAVPSALFYHDTLIPEALNTTALCNWPGWRGRRWPVLFINNGGLDESHEEGASFYNIREANIACRTVKRFVDSGLLQPNEIAVMSAFKEQVRRLRNCMRSQPYGIKGVNIGPLEVYQGSEHKCVILCTTRTRERFLEADTKKGMGIIFESRKFNVAMTRAKYGLVVIGNPWILCKDPSWEIFLSFCWRNGLVEEDCAEASPNTIEQEQQHCDSKGTTVVSSPILSSTHLGASSSPPPVFNEGNKNNDGSRESPNLSSGGSDVACAYGGSIKRVNFWQPSKDEQDTPQCLSRLERALVMRDKLTGMSKDGVLQPLNKGYRYEDEDQMWIAGLAAEEALRGADLASLTVEA